MDISKHLENFKNHEAKITNYGNIKILDWKAPDSNHYRIRYLFEEDYCRLHISGDLGTLVAQNYNNMRFEHFESYCNNPNYFITKVECVERGLYKYDYSLAKEQLTEIFDEDEFNDEALKWLDNYSVDDVLEHYSDEYGFNYYGISELLDRSVDITAFDPDYWEWIGDIGKRIKIEIYLYLIGFHMAMEYLRKKESEGE